MPNELHKQCQKTEKRSVSYNFQKTKQVFDISPAAFRETAKKISWTMITFYIH